MTAPSSSPNPCNLKGKTTHTKKHPHTALTVSPCPPSYPVLSHSEQDSLLSLSGPSDPCGPHPLQRSPEAQQVHASRNLTSTKTSLILTSRPLQTLPGPGGRCVLVLRVCVRSAGVMLWWETRVRVLVKSGEGQSIDLGSSFFI